jgi:ABC-type multidrug transport system ATPase subunit
MIKIKHLRKMYGEIAAVDDATFTANAGEIFGLLGPNGAGKTTTIGCISGLLTPTSGRILVDGHHVVREDSATVSAPNASILLPSIFAALSSAGADIRGVMFSVKLCSQFFFYLLQYFNLLT